MDQNRVIVIVLIVIAVLFFAVLIGLFAWGAIGTAKDQCRTACNENKSDEIEFLSDAGSVVSDVPKEMPASVKDDGAGVEPPKSIEIAKPEEQNNNKSQAQIRAFNGSIMLELPIKPVNDFGMAVGHKYKGTVLSEHKVPLVECINLCRDNDDCIGVNYRGKDNTCQLLSKNELLVENIDWTALNRQ